MLNSSIGADRVRFFFGSVKKFSLLGQEGSRIPGHFRESVFGLQTFINIYRLIRPGKYVRPTGGDLLGSQRVGGPT